MINLSDYVMSRLAEYGVRHVFMVSGGGAMNLVDSVGRNKSLAYICPHHEQAAAIAAEGYSRVDGRLGVVLVTSGPGGTNALTGVIGQWLDSVPCLYVSGQIKQETSIVSCPKIKLRQLGDQEINIVDMVKPVTKYAVMVRDPKTIGYHLDRAIYLATHGRPGPVWLDIPLDVQGSTIDVKELVAYDSKIDEIKQDKKELSLKVRETIEALKKSKRPVFVAGNGIRISGAKKGFLKLTDKLKMPILSTFNGMDLVTGENPFYAGRIGTLGNRAGNYALQNSDLYLCVGSRNNIRQIGYNWKTYAREAYKIIVDIDQSELEKPTIIPDLPVNSDASLFLDELEKQLISESLPDWSSWISWCMDKKSRYPVVSKENALDTGCVDPYFFAKTMTECMKPGDTLVAGDGTACVVPFQAGIVKENQRFIWNSGCASMGYDLPAAMGACIAKNNDRVICLAGDGSLQMNIQELQTVFFHKLPLKIFVLNNQGYISIRQTQDAFFNGRYVGSSEESGVSFPDIVKVAKAYNLSTSRIENHKNLSSKIMEVLEKPGPVVCEVKLKTDYKFSPKASSEKKPDGRIISKPLEDLYPFLNRDEFRKNMIIEPLKE